MRMKNIRLADSFKPALIIAVIQQLVILFFAAMFLDGGLIAQKCFYACLAFWCSAALIIVRRPTSPTPTDLVFIQIGYLPVCAITFLLTPLIWRWRGFEYR